MMRTSQASTPRRFRRLSNVYPSVKLLVSAAFSLSLFLVLDFLISQFIIIGSRFDRYTPFEENPAIRINRAFRVEHHIFHHTLRPNFDGPAQWGPNLYRIRTNDLGFLDEAPRNVAKIPVRRRLVFIGDSFTEGVGYPWEQTFVGLLSRSLSEAEILNAAVSSYSPTVYYIKIKWLLDQGYFFDHVVVLIDISDIHDETLYAVHDGAIIQYGRSVFSPPPSDLANLRRSTQARFQLTMFALHLAKSAMVSFVNEPLPARPASRRESVFNLCRSAWTYDKGNPQTEKYYQRADSSKLLDFDPMAYCPRRNESASLATPSPNYIDTAIDKALHSMSELHELLAGKGIQLSVGVYPWPAQLHHNDSSSLQVALWESWCKSRCAHFINAFPDFFEYRNRPGFDWYEHLFIEGDVHFNSRGHKIMADKIYNVLKSEIRR